MHYKFSADEDQLEAAKPFQCEDFIGHKQARKKKKSARMEGLGDAAGLKGGGERGIRTLGAVLPTHSLSRRAPSADSVISPAKLTSKKYGGGSRIRTHGTFVQRFSRPPP